MMFTEEPLINVGIITDKKISFELYGEFKVTGSKDTYSGLFNAEVTDDRIVCSSNTSSYEFSDEVFFEPGDLFSDSFLVKDVIIGVGFHWQRKESQQFNHSLKLVRYKDNLIAINILPLEDYLTSVISSEMNAKSFLQSLKAQAVVSRSWVLAQLEKSELVNTDESLADENQAQDEHIRWYSREQHTNFDVCADDHCQRFQGITKITTDIARKAVFETRGIVLMYDGNICDTRYSKSCGGITENSKNVWEPIDRPYLKSVIDYKHEPDDFNLNFTKEVNASKWINDYPPAYCNTDDETILSQILVDFDQETKDFFRWKLEYSQEELSAIIKEKSGFDFGNIIDLVPVERGQSARLTKLKIVGSKKTLVVGKELEIRRILSKTHLYSSAFVIEKEFNDADIPVKFILSGAGWGHGVGLCQIGCAVMAEKGHEFDEILLHYFSNAAIKKIY
ncbi:MAG: SpoIID/LytB domain-containing protein [Ignavibacterium sp.]|nr:MAG: SpoIID/LytB domain-containing protein [Ignavibacterium sp.]